MLGVLGGCELAVEVDIPEHDPQLVAHSFFAPDSVWAVRLRRNADIAGREDIKKSAVADATVRIADETGNFSTTLTHIGEGAYAAPAGAHPIPGVAYALEAEAPGLPAIRAVSSIPEAKASIEELERLDDPDDGRVNPIEVYRIRIRIEDPPATNYYKLELFGSYPIGETEDGTFIPVSSLAFNRIFFESNEASFRPYDYAYFFDSPDVEGGDAVYSAALFSDELFDGETQSFEITFTSFSLQDVVKSRYKLVLTAMSEDYFLYHHTAFLQVDALDALPIEAALLQTPPVHLHSNVDGGLGVIAGYAVHAFGFDEEGNVWVGEDKPE